MDQTCRCILDSCAPSTSFEYTFVTRIACTIQFFKALFGGQAELTSLQIVMLILVLCLPYMFFLSTIVHRGRYGAFLFVGSVISKIVSPVITYAMAYFNDLNWGKTHGSQPTHDEVVGSTPALGATPDKKPIGTLNASQRPTADLRGCNERHRLM